MSEEAINQEPAEQPEQPAEQPAETPESIGDEIRKGYDRVANPNPEPATEEPPPEAKPEPNPEMELLKKQVDRIPDLQKRLDDVNGRYGRLTQKFDEIQRRIATSATTDAAARATADAGALLKEIDAAFEDFPEIGEKMKAVFSKGFHKAAVDPEEVDKRVSQKLAESKQAEVQTAMAALSEAHPDWMAVRETDDYKVWLDTLTPRVKARFLSSMDAYYVADKLDEFKDWQGSRKTAPASNDRLKSAITPTSGTKPAPRGEPSLSESFRAGYNKIAKARIT